MEESISNTLIKIKLTSVKYQVRRKCWTEMCRKVDGRDKKKEKNERRPAMLHPYSSDCFQLFIQT